MNLQQCWTTYLQAEKLLEQGHWPQAHYLFEDVLHHLPHHIQHATHDENTKPCQMSCLIAGLRDAAVYQSEILNNMGQYQRAFEVLNQSYALLQFMSIEESDLVAAVSRCWKKTVMICCVTSARSASRSAMPLGNWNMNRWKKHTTISPN